MIAEPLKLRRLLQNRGLSMRNGDTPNDSQRGSDPHPQEDRDGTASANRVGPLSTVGSLDEAVKQLGLDENIAR
jgi:hypothetical protein